MKSINKPSKRYRSLLIGGGIAIAITSVLIACYGSCTRTRTDTDDTGSTSEVTTECTTTTTSTVTTSTSTSSTTVESTTTTTTVLTTMNVNTTLAQIETQPYVVATQPVVVEQQPVEASGDLPISARDYELLCKIVASEYGGMSDVYERAKIVASVMNQSYRTGQSVESCLYTSCVPWGFCPNNTWFCSGSVYYADMADAVDYYFANKDTVFADWQADSWYASGYGINIFHRQLW